MKRILETLFTYFSYSITFLMVPKPTQRKKKKKRKKSQFCYMSDRREHPPRATVLRIYVGLMM